MGLLRLLPILWTQKVLAQNDALSSFLAQPSIASLQHAMETNTDTYVRNSLSLEINGLISSFVLTYEGPVGQSSPAPVQEPTQSLQEPVQSVQVSAQASEQGLPITIVQTQVITPTPQPSLTAPSLPAQTSLSAQAPFVLSPTAQATIASALDNLMPHVGSDLQSTGSYAARASSFLQDSAVQFLTSEWGTATNPADQVWLSSELDNMYSVFISQPVQQAGSSDSSSDSSARTIAGSAILETSTVTQSALPTESLQSQLTGLQETSLGSVESPAPGGSQALITGTTPLPASTAPPITSSNASVETSNSGDVFSDPRMLSLSQLFMTATDSQVQLSALSAINGLYSSLNGQTQGSAGGGTTTEQSGQVASSVAASLPSNSGNGIATGAAAFSGTPLLTTEVIATSTALDPNSESEPIAPLATGESTGESPALSEPEATPLPTNIATSNPALASAGSDTTDEPGSEATSEPEVVVSTATSTDAATGPIFESATSEWSGYTNGAQNSTTSAGLFSNGSSSAQPQAPVSLETGDTGPGGNGSAGTSTPFLANVGHKHGLRVEACLFILGSLFFTLL